METEEIIHKLEAKGIKPTSNRILVMKTLVNEQNPLSLRDLEQKMYALTDKERNELLNRFFYTISVNYSIYAFNPADYEVPLGETDDKDTYGGEWLDYLFHKNDGYYVPMVLTPFRNRGEMNMGNESVLAEQRISVLSLLYHSQKKEFLEDYVPCVPGKAANYR